MNRRDIFRLLAGAACAAAIELGAVKPVFGTGYWRAVMGVATSPMGVEFPYVIKFKRM